MSTSRLGWTRWIALAGIALGCSASEPFTRNNIVGTAELPPHAESERCTQKNPAVRQYNGRVLRENYQREWAFNRGDADDLPKVGLALSGGGVRSASFAIGVLAALQKDRVLPRVDVISSVSGGSYALYWYYTQMLNLGPEESPDNLFRSCQRRDRDDTFQYRDYDTNESCNPLESKYRFQRHLEHHSRLLFAAENKFLRGVEGTGKLSAWLLSYPYHLLLNFLWDTGQNTNPLADYYEAGIRRTYGLVPRARPEDARMRGADAAGEAEAGEGAGGGDLAEAGGAGTRAGGIEAVDPAIDQDDPGPISERYRNVDPGQITFLYEPPARHVPMSTLARRIADEELPFFIINTNAVYGDARLLFRSFGTEDTSLRTSVFEFTPLGYGSDSFRYQYFEPIREQAAPIDPNVSRAVSISGAAVDLKKLGFLVEILNIKLGRYVKNYEISDGKRALKRSVPWPFYYAVNRSLDKASPDIYLTDGGHAENLGLFTLIRRGVRTVIAVDAERDDRSGFSSAIRLKRALRSELNIDFDIDRQGLFDTLANDGEILTGSVAILKGKADPDDRFAPPVACGDEGELEKRPTPPSALKIIYIKLSADRSRMSQNACTDVELYEETCTGEALETSTRYRAFCNEIADEAERRECLRTDPCRAKRLYPCSVADYAADENESFPHVSTADVMFTPQQFRAYRDLGSATIARRLEVVGDDVVLRGESANVP